MRHLTTEQAIASLGRSKQIEQLIELGRTDDGTPTVRYLTLSPGPPITLSVHHVVDIGSDDFHDVTEFPPVDPGEYVGEGVTVLRTDDVNRAIDYASQLGAVADRWVNQSLIEAEYADARRNRSPEDLA